MAEMKNLKIEVVRYNPEVDATVLRGEVALVIVVTNEDRKSVV